MEIWERELSQKIKLKIQFNLLQENRGIIYLSLIRTKNVCTNISAEKLREEKN